jgi:ribonuclease BN (tRNA processing enzyme)
MRVTILGSGTGVPHPGRRPPGVVVVAEGQTILFDSGSGTVQQLGACGFDYRNVAAAVYTHVHADHTLDLVALLHALNYTPGYTRREPLLLVGPVGFGHFLSRLLSAFPGLESQPYELVVQEIGDGAELCLGECRLQAAAVPHGNAPGNAYRLTTPEGVLALSGDCAPNRALVRLARKADLLISEASFPYSTPEAAFHLTAAQAGQMAEQAGVRNLVLTHLYPSANEYDTGALCARHYQGQIILAKDGMVIRIRHGKTVEVDGFANPVAVPHLA